MLHLGGPSLGISSVICIRHWIFALCRKPKSLHRCSQQELLAARGFEYPTIQFGRNDSRRDRIKKLESSPSEQELEIRKKLKLLRPGETSFILPEQPKQPSDQPTDPASSDHPSDSK